VSLTGEGGGALANIADHVFAVPSRSTPLIQQVHLDLYHYLCKANECEFAVQGVEPDQFRPAF
jgi:D-sedoheptulose 7-phosphate isomerase